MIPIRFKENEKETVNRLYHGMLDRKPKPGDNYRNKYLLKLKEVNAWCKRNISIEGQPYTFPQIIQADFKTIQCIAGMDFMSDEKQIGIEISNHAVISSNVEKLKLREVYQVHSDLVQECIKKAVIFNPDYLEYLYYMYGGLFESKDELYRTVFGNCPDECSYGKRPLAKLPSDIMRNLLNLYYGLGW